METLKKEISHSGEIVEIREGEVKVKILSQSACCNCLSHDSCPISEKTEKIIHIRINNKSLADILSQYHLGQKVEVAMSPQIGKKAICFSYLIPSMILLILVLSLSLIKVNELLIGLSAIVGLFLYYLLMYLFKGFISDKGVFYIKSQRFYD